MKYEITTKQGTNYIVSADSVWLWIQLERDLGYTLSQAREKIVNGSLEVATYMVYLASKAAGHTELKLHQSWVENELESFQVVEDDPKATDSEASNEA
jgi:hypothetical protein